MKILGYIFAGIGVAGIAAYSIPELKTALQLSKVNDTTLLIVSICAVLVGLFFLFKKGGQKQPKEVPIFQGKNVVGYRRH